MKKEELFESIYIHLKRYGNTPVGAKFWKRYMEDILAYLRLKGMKVNFRKVTYKKYDSTDFFDLPDFYVVEVVKK